jgi:hypothetical protein
MLGAPRQSMTIGPRAVQYNLRSGVSACPELPDQTERKSSAASSPPARIEVEA